MPVEKTKNFPMKIRENLSEIDSYYHKSQIIHIKSTTIVTYAEKKIKFT